MDKLEQILSEAIDLNNSEGIKMMMQLDESEKINLTDKMVSALYNSALSVSNGIDFGLIPVSKGDINKFKYYDLMINSLKTLFNIESQFNIKIPELKIINDSLKILEAYKKEFCLSFIQDKSIGILIYNTIVYSNMCAINLCITSFVSFITTPNAELQNTIKYQKEYDKKSAIIFNNLQKFNDSANSGELKELFNKILTKNNFFSVGAIATFTVAALVSVAGIIIAIRELIYFIYRFRMKLSDMFKLQAQLLELNIAELKSSNAPSTVANKNEVIKKQQKKLNQLIKLSDKFQLEFIKSSKKANDDLSKRLKPDDALTSDPRDISSFSLA